MKKFAWLVCLLFFQCSTEIHQATDFTEENLFSGNIEGPAFDKEGNLYVVNFERDGTIGKVNSNGEVSLFLSLPDSSIANSIQFDSKGNMFLADFIGHSVLHVEMETKGVSVFVHHDEFNQPNDLCINKKDQLFASDPNWKEGSGKIWRIDQDQSITLLTDQMGTTNGIALSPDEKILYVNESVQRKIWAFDVDDKGDISNKRIFAMLAEYGFDGMKCDTDGNLYVTRYGKGTILILSPTGETLDEISLKGKNCSNLVFGGNKGKTVFVTLQDRKGIEKFENDIAGKGWSQ